MTVTGYCTDGISSIAERSTSGSVDVAKIHRIAELSITSEGISFKIDVTTGFGTKVVKSNFIFASDSRSCNLLDRENARRRFNRARKVTQDRRLAVKGGLELE